MPSTLTHLLEPWYIGIVLRHNEHFQLSHCSCILDNSVKHSHHSICIQITQNDFIWCNRMICNLMLYERLIGCDHLPLLCQGNIRLLHMFTCFFYGLGWFKIVFRSSTPGMYPSKDVFTSIGWILHVAPCNHLCITYWYYQSHKVHPISNTKKYDLTSAPSAKYLAS